MLTEEHQSSVKNANNSNNKTLTTAQHDEVGGAKTIANHSSARSPKLISTTFMRRKAILLPLQPSSASSSSQSLLHPSYIAPRGNEDENRGNNNNFSTTNSLNQTTTAGNLLILSGGSSAITNSRRVSTIRRPTLASSPSLSGEGRSVVVAADGDKNVQTAAPCVRESDYAGQTTTALHHNNFVLAEIASSQNAEGNPLAAIANTIAVDAKMRTISSALAITASNPDAEALRFAQNCNLLLVEQHTQNNNSNNNQNGGGDGSGGEHEDVTKREEKEKATAKASYYYCPFGTSVDVSSADLDASRAVGAYILIEEDVRCPKTDLSLGSDQSSSSVAAAGTTSFYSPRMASEKRYHCAVAAHHLFALSPQDPFFMYETAEQMLESSDACNATWVSASEQFERAAQSFATLGLFRMAANAQVRQYDCLKALGQKNDAAQSLIAASHYHTQEGLADDSSTHREANEAALACMQNAIGVYDDEGMDVTAAKLCAEAAELCVKARNAGLGVDLLHVAAGTFEAADQLSHAERCYARAAEIAILDMRDFAEAIDTLEKMARVTSLSRQHLAYFKAFICRFVCVPPEQGIPFVVAMENCEKTLKLYEEICPALVGAPEEHNLIKEMMLCQKKMEDERLEEVIGKYLEAHGPTMECWAELILRKIHENLVLRKASVQKLYKL